MDKPMIAVEVVYALADKQKLLRLAVPQGTSVREAALRSGMDGYFPGLGFGNVTVGHLRQGGIQAGRAHACRGGAS